MRNLQIVELSAESEESNDFAQWHQDGILAHNAHGPDAFLGYLLGGSSGLVVGFAFALLTNVFAYWNSDKVALAMAGARPVSRAEALGLHRIVEEFAIYAGIPKPWVRGREPEPERVRDGT